MQFLGVDGGGTKTAALLVDESGRVVGWGLGGGSNYQTMGMATAVAGVSAATAAALNGQTPDAAGFCLAGADMPHDFRVLGEQLDALFPNFPYTLRNDVIGIFRAGSRFPYGAGVVSGTGFNAGGIDRMGKEFRFPALGGVTGDRAGGEYIGIQAIGAAFRAWDGRGAATALADAVLLRFATPDFETLAERWVQGAFTDHDIRQLTPLVFELCAAGDAVARRIIEEEGIEIGAAANAVLRRLNLTGEDCDVVLGGSVFHGVGSTLLDTITRLVGECAPRAQVRRLEVPPVVGAVLLAADHVGFAVDAQFSAALRATLPRELRVPSQEA